MITINLLPMESLRSQVQGKAFLAALFLFIIIFIGGGLVYKANVVTPTLANITQEISSLSAEEAAMKGKITKADGNIKNIVKMWARMMSILELEERRRDQTRLLVELDELLPKSNAWLLGFTNNGGAVNIKGIATDKEVVSQFYSQLEKSKYLRKVALVMLSQDLVLNGIKLTQFNITAEAYFPDPDIIKSGLPEVGLPSKEEFMKALEKASPSLAKGLQTVSDRKAL